MTTASPDASSDTGTVLARSHGAVTVLTLSYAARRNALSMPLRAALHTQLEQAMADPECRAVVLTGEGGHFCSGGDISSFGGVTPASGRARMQRVHAIVRLLVRGEKPVIAAVEGHAAGAGLCIAAACDVVVASREAKLSCTFNKIGLFPDLGGAWSIPLRMGLGRAKLLMMTGRVMDAATAAQQGLVDQLAEPGQALTDALAMAQEMCAVSPLSNGMLKSVLARGPMPLEDLLAAEIDAQAVLYGSEDFHEGREALPGQAQAGVQGALSSGFRGSARGVNRPSSSAAPSRR
ncbi:MAG: enoyl-CoA hydratase/isomerase family protein [Betaproteobacteria bacterium]|nr:enoyl-CoA hydratase/isomerase family protein [Betaproteobacteria bacterium]